MKGKCKFIKMSACTCGVSEVKMIFLVANLPSEGCDGMFNSSNLSMYQVLNVIIIYKKKNKRWPNFAQNLFFLFKVRDVVKQAKNELVRFLLFE